MKSLNKLYALGRLKAGERNKTEAAYETYLEGLKQAGEVLWYQFEGMKFRLADNCFYCPDFAVMKKNGEMELREVKSVWLGDGKTKIRMAAEQFPFRFIAVYAKPKKEGGGWREEEF